MIYRIYRVSWNGSFCEFKSKNSKLWNRKSFWLFRLQLCVSQSSDWRGWNSRQDEKNSSSVEGDRNFYRNFPIAGHSFKRPMWIQRNVLIEHFFIASFHLQGARTGDSHRNSNACQIVTVNSSPEFLVVRLIYPARWIVFDLVSRILPREYYPESIT